MCRLWDWANSTLLVEIFCFLWWVYVLDVNCLSVWSHAAILKSVFYISKSVFLCMQSFKCHACCYSRCWHVFNEEINIASWVVMSTTLGNWPEAGSKLPYNQDFPPISIKSVLLCFREARMGELVWRGTIEAPDVASIGMTAHRVSGSMKYVRSVSYALYPTVNWCLRHCCIIQLCVTEAIKVIDIWLKKLRMREHFCCWFEVAAFARTVENCHVMWCMIEILSYKVPGLL